MVKGLEQLSQAMMLEVLGLLTLEKRTLRGYIECVSGRELPEQEYPTILSISEHIFNQNVTGFHNTV